MRRGMAMRRAGDSGSAGGAVRRARGGWRWLPLALIALGASSGSAQLLVASQNSEQILRYDAADGSFSGVFVEPVTQGFQIPGGLALHPSNGGLYVSSTGSGEIWRYDAGTGAVFSPAETSAAFQPGGLAFDATGSALYFLDPADGLSLSIDSVKRFTLGSGSVTTIATDSGADFSAVALNGSDLYLSDTFNQHVIRFPTGGGGSAVVISGLLTPGQILFRSATDLLLAETGSDRVLEYLLVSGSWVLDRVVLPASAGVDGPFGLALAPDGRLSVSGANSHEVVAVDLDTLAVSPLVAPGAGGLSSPGALAWSGTTLLVASLASNDVIYYDQTGAPTGTRARGISPPVDGGLAIAPGGNVVAASMVNNDLVELDGAGGGLLRQFFDACPSFLDAPYDVTFDSGGDVYVSCQFSNSVHRFDGETANPLGFFVHGGAGGLVLPRGLAFGPSGNLYVASVATNEILEYDGASGSFVSTFVTAANGGASPTGLVFHDGALYVSYQSTDEVRAFDATSGSPLSVFVSPGSGGLDAPAGLSFGPNGNLFVASSGTDEVLEYDGASGSFVSVFVGAGSGGLDGAIDLAFQSSPGAVEPVTVPALGTGAAALLVSGLALVGTRRVRRLR